MCPSGIDDFPAADDETLHDGMARAAQLGLPVAVHAESDELTRGSRPRQSPRADLAARLPRTPGRSSPSSRPSPARSRSPRRPAARCTSSTSRAAAAVRLVAEARARGVDVTCETCPHYLALDEEDAVRGRDGREVLAAASGRARTSTTSGARVLDGARRPDRRVRPLAEPAGAEAGRRRVRRLGRDRRRAVAAEDPAHGGPTARALARGDRDASRRRRLRGASPRWKGIDRARRRRRSRRSSTSPHEDVLRSGELLLPPPSQPLPRAQPARPGRPHDRSRMHCCPRWGYGRSSGGRMVRPARPSTEARP